MKTRALIILLAFGATAGFSQKKGTITDNRDGQVYNTIEVGNSVWMADNLNFNAEGSWCYEDFEENCTQYGKLYSWNVAMADNSNEGNNGICPEGWSIPTKADWETLVESYKKTKDLLEGGLSGFEVNMSGLKFPNSSYGFLDKSAAFWSSSKDESITTGEYVFTWYFYIDQKNKEPQRYSTDVEYGQSVRCIKKDK